jgi:hypothetical protein
VKKRRKSQKTKVAREFCYFLPQYRFYLKSVIEKTFWRQYANKAEYAKYHNLRLCDIAHLPTNNSIAHPDRTAIVISRLRD